MLTIIVNYHNKFQQFYCSVHYMFIFIQMFE